MKNKPVEEEFPILKEVNRKIDVLSSSHVHTELLKRLAAEFKLLVLYNKKLKKQITLLKILNEKKVNKEK